MQVGDYIIQQVNAHNVSFFAIFKLLNIQIDGYLHVETQAYYNDVTKQYDRLGHIHKPIKHITTARIKPYHPTLEELFIFKSFKEQLCSNTHFTNSLALSNLGIN